MKEIRESIERENLENSTIKNVPKSSLNEKIKLSFIGQGQVDTWHHLRGLSEASSPRNLEFSNKMTILHEVQQFLMIVQNKKYKNINFRLLRAFCMTVRNFRMIMQNQFWDSPLVCSTNTFWSILHSHAWFLHDHAK